MSSVAGPKQSFTQKMTTRFKKEPLIPLGLGAVVVVLSRGINAFTRGDQSTSFRMMRYRVIFQAGVAFVLLFGVFFRIGGSDHEPKTFAETRTASSVDKEYFMDVGVEYCVEDGKPVFGLPPQDPEEAGERS